MGALRKMRLRLRGLFGNASLDAEMNKEMREHLELRVERNIAAGMSAGQARDAAARAFGGMDQIKERCRDERGWRWPGEVARDMTYASRMIRKNPGFTAICVLVLALGIGVTATMFSVVYGVLVDPYPYARSNEIWDPDVADAKTGQGIDFNVGDYLEMAKLPGVSAVMATGFDGMTLTGEFGPRFVNARRISGNAFQFLGVPPIYGRTFTAADVRPNGTVEPVVVLSYAFWKGVFHGSPDVVGRTIMLDDNPYVVLGVMPDRFGWYTDFGLWLPLPTTDLTREARPILRLRPGVTKEVAGQQLLSLFMRIAHEQPSRFPKAEISAKLENYLDVTSASGEMQSSLEVLFCVVGILLLIACTNVANLQLARGSSRRREIAVRLALGAGRARIVRQLLTESLVMSLVGGALGLALAYGLKQGIVALMPPDHIPNEARVTINVWVLAFSFAVSVLTGVVFGLAPALQSTRSDLNDALKDGGHSGAPGGAKGSAMRDILVVVEVALSVVLLVGAGLAVRGFVQLSHVDRGYKSDGLSVVPVSLVHKTYGTVERRNAMARNAVSSLQAINGVTSVAIGPFPGYDQISLVTIPGQPKPPAGFGVGLSSDTYFQTMGIQFRQGVDFTAAQVAHGDHVAIINEAARKFWLNGADPMGRTFDVDLLAGDVPNSLALANGTKTVTVIGIVSDVGAVDPKGPPLPMVYVPYTLRGQANFLLFARSSLPPSSLFKQFREEIQKLDKDMPVRNPRPVDLLLDRYVAQPRFNMTLFTAFAAIALALAAAGIYSVLSYSVAQRTREFGVRLALGAESGDILRLVFSSGGRLVAAGLVLGLGASAALTAIVKSEVFTVPLFDPMALAGSAALLTLVALLACLVPARRATRVNPLVALRCD